MSTDSRAGRFGSRGLRGSRGELPPSGSFPFPLFFPPCYAGICHGHALPPTCQMMMENCHARWNISASKGTHRSHGECSKIKLNACICKGNDCVAPDTVAQGICYIRNKENRVASLDDSPATGRHPTRAKTDQARRRNQTRTKTSLKAILVTRSG